MSEPPAQKIVSKKQYLILRSKKLGLYSLSAALTVVAGALLIDTAIHVVHWKNGSNFLIPGLIGAAISCLGSALWGLIMFASTVTLIDRTRKRARAMMPVQPLTDRNVHLLPPQETLVRSSEMPPAEQQSILLRPVQKGPETPPEQLLRAGRGGTK